jgi:2-octaprenyl-6-methoxyphenol hydroxylase
MNFDIAIIGGSFAGMTAALALSNISNDLKIVIIEKQNILNEDKKRDGRSYAISSASLKLFKEIKIYDEVKKFAGKIADIKITDYKSPFILDFLGHEVDEKEGQLGQIIENFHIHNALRNQIIKRKNIKVFAPNFYEEINFDKEEDLVKIKLNNGEIINSKLLLACDGRFSPLRDQKYKIPTTKKNYQQKGIVFNISHEKSHKNIAHEKFLPGGPLAILPMNDLHQSSIVWIAPDDLADAILDLDEENFKIQLLKKLEDELGDVEVVTEKFSYPLILVEAKKFHHEKMILIGDAACGVHPIAGQGFNLAIASINILSEIIEKNLQNGLDFSSQMAILEYEKKAKFNAKKMLIATDILNSLFETRSLSISIARDFGIGFVNKFSKLKKLFIKSAGGF